MNQSEEIKKLSNAMTALASCIIEIIDDRIESIHERYLLNTGVPDPTPPPASSPADPTPWMSRKEVAELLGVCTHTVARMGRNGELKFIKLNSRFVRYRSEDVQKLIFDATI